ncbi:uncharacterized protein LOC108950158 [Ciona intestinalis]
MNGILVGVVVAVMFCISGGGCVKTVESRIQQPNEVNVTVGSVRVAKFVPNRGSMLVYLDRLNDQDEATFIEECNSRRFDFTVYYRMVYFRLCNVTDEQKVLERVTKKSRFDELCRVFNNGNDNEIQNLGKKYKIFGAGIEAEERQLTVKACDFINDYYNEKTALNATLSYPQYTEWLIHSVPFNLPVACGFTRARYNSSSTPSSYNCLATSHVASLYVTYFIDSCILTLIVISNIVILTVTWNTKSMHTAHGLFRSSLASADLIIAIVVAGSMNTTRRIYFGPHKFLGEGEYPSMLDYLPQVYIDTFGALTVMSLSASILTLACTSVDRFVAILKPLRYKLSTRGFLKIGFASLALVWLISFAVAIYPVFDHYSPYQVTALGVIIAVKVRFNDCLGEYPTHILTCVTFHQAFPVYISVMGSALLATWVVNIWIIILVKRQMDKTKHTKASNRLSVHSNATPKRQSSANGNTNNIYTIEAGMYSEDRNGTNNNNNNNASHSDRPGQASVSRNSSSASTTQTKSQVEIALAQTVRMVVGALTLAILPSIAVMIAGTTLVLEPRSSQYNPQSKAAWNSFAYIASRVLFANSFFNCLIYSYRNKGFRTASKRVLSFRSLRRGSSGSQAKCQPPRNGN